MGYLTTLYQLNLLLAPKSMGKIIAFGELESSVVRKLL
jgi:hypothetical protein